MKKLCCLLLVLLVAPLVFCEQVVGEDITYSIEINKSQGLRLGDYLNYTIRTSDTNETYGILIVKNMSFQEVYRRPIALNGSFTSDFYLAEEYGPGIYTLDFYALLSVIPNASATVKVLKSISAEIAEANSNILDRFNETAQEILWIIWATDQDTKKELNATATSLQAQADGLIPLAIGIIVGAIIASAITSLVILYKYRPIFFLSGEPVRSSRFIEGFVGIIPKIKRKKKIDKILEANYAEGENIRGALQTKGKGLSQLDKLRVSTK